MPSTSSTNTGQRVPWHNQYYIHGGDAVFSVENTLFRVHRFFLTRDSSWFREKLPYPASPGETIKGSSDNLPLVLEGDVTKSDFERFLWVFYNPKYSLYDASIEEWTSILKLAHAWSSIEVKELAIRGLEGLQIPALQKIVLYQTYDVDRNHLQTAYTALTVRDEPITIEEGRELGLETSLQLARAREVARAPVFSGRGVGNPRSPVNLAGVELNAIINDIFGLASASQQHTTQTPTGSANARDTSQTGTAQTNTGSSSNTSQGTGSHANGSTTGNGTNGHTNGATNNTTRGGRR